MLQRIDLKNFKCFEDLQLECAPLNLLCGLNGMGKSTIIQALLVLRQSFDYRSFNEGRLLLSDRLVDLGSGLDILFDGADSQVVGFALHGHQGTVSSSLEMEFAYSEDTDQFNAVSDGTQNGTEFVPDDWRSVSPFAENLVYVNAERAGPRKLYPFSDPLARHDDFGSSAEYAWNYLNTHKNDLLPEYDPRCPDANDRKLLNVVNYWLQNVSPGVSLQLDEVTLADVIILGFSFNRSSSTATRSYRAINVGFGLSYVLPVILALLSPPSTLCLIENPEAHLHPRGQTKLAELASHAANAGIQVIVETHSDHFMDGVRIAVRDGVISPDQANFHYFEREGDKTIVTSPQVDENGRLSRWPSGFFDQHEENLARLIGPR